MTPRFLQLFGNDVPLQELIVGENHAAGDFIETARMFENFVAVVIATSGR